MADGSTKGWDRPKLILEVVVQKDLDLLDIREHAALHKTDSCS